MLVPGWAGPVTPGWSAIAADNGAAADAVGWAATIIATGNAAANAIRPPEMIGLYRSQWDSPLPRTRLFRSGAGGKNGVKYR